MRYRFALLLAVAVSTVSPTLAQTRPEFTPGGPFPPEQGSRPSPNYGDVAPAAGDAASAGDTMTKKPVKKKMSSKKMAHKKMMKKKTM